LPGNRAAATFFALAFETKAKAKRTVSPWWEAMKWLRVCSGNSFAAIAACAVACTMAWPAPATAQPNPACQSYADFAVQQFRSKTLLRCEGGLGEWWSGDYNYHYGWCASLPAASPLPMKGIADRAQVLARCESVNAARQAAPPTPPTAPQSAASADCERIVGVWSSARGETSFSADGAVAQQRRSGRWECKSRGGPAVVIWSDTKEGEIVSSDGVRLRSSGQLHDSTRVSETPRAATALRGDPNDELFRDFFNRRGPPSSSAPPQTAQAPAPPQPQSTAAPGWSKHEAVVTLRALADNPARGVLGIRIAGSAPVLEALRPGLKTGVLVTHINQDSASTGVLQRGDIVVAASGQATNTPIELVNAVSRFTPGMPVVLELWRHAGGFPQLQAALFARAQQNDPAATYVLGWLEAVPPTGEPNHARAFAFYHRAAALNHLQATEATANAYRDGRGTEKNVLEAAKWYRRAADAGSPAAMYNLASLVVDGQVGPADPAEAFRLMQRAAAGGYAMAHYRLAGYFDSGRGTARDPQAGARHLLAAARAGPEMPLFVGTDLAKTNPSTELITALQQQLAEAGVYQGPRDGKLSLDVTAALGRLQSGAAR
jgi:hypothetical protein